MQIFSTVVFTIWLLYVWIEDSHFGSQPDCNHLVKYVILFFNVPANSIWLRIFFIISLVFAAFSLLFKFSAIVSVHMENFLDSTPIGEQKNSPTKVASVRAYSLSLSLVSAVYGVATLELIIQRNKGNIQSGEDAWGFGQIVSLILILECLIDVAVTVRTRYMKRNTPSSV
ncbi:hypothetical protein B0F90DRAFT_1023006 [Multifurca ochricompacta]|uniref:Uncharacterized protein n=1 Tax=Multifurca ochricompacta TaxID=376703 RepID=A0AAD4M091_9AGAM|nr:hypothetical protein B0F90DRAFT_1023006 [Multifurca ochricompacta]